MNYIKNKIFVFDIETVIDIELSRNFLSLKKSESTDKVLKKIKKYYSKVNSSYNCFFKIPFHKIVAISYLDASIQIDNNNNEKYNIYNIKSGGQENSSEYILVKGFFEYLKKTNARLITFNGRSFDLQVLKYRAMRYDISASWLYNDGDKWNNYMYRYNLDWHCDLLEVLTSFGLSRKIRMSEISSLYSIPCKLDNDGLGVERMFYQNKIKKIRNYCEQDVVSTYLLYLKYILHVGKMLYIDYKECIYNLKKFIVNNNKKHLIKFIENLK